LFHLDAESSTKAGSKKKFSIEKGVHSSGEDENVSGDDMYSSGGEERKSSWTVEQRQQRSEQKQGGGAYREKRNLGQDYASSRTTEQYSMLQGGETASALGFELSVDQSAGRSLTSQPIAGFSADEWSRLTTSQQTTYLQRAENASGGQEAGYGAGNRGQLTSGSFSEHHQQQTALLSGPRSGFTAEEWSRLTTSQQSKYLAEGQQSITSSSQQAGFASGAGGDGFTSGAGVHGFTSGAGGHGFTSGAGGHAAGAHHFGSVAERQAAILSGKQGDFTDEEWAVLTSGQYSSSSLPPQAILSDQRAGFFAAEWARYTSAQQSGGSVSDLQGQGSQAAAGLSSDDRLSYAALAQQSDARMLTHSSASTSKVSNQVG